MGSSGHQVTPAFRDVPKLSWDVPCGILWTPSKLQGCAGLSWDIPLGFLDTKSPQPRHSIWSGLFWISHYVQTVLGCVIVRMNVFLHLSLPTFITPSFHPSLPSSLPLSLPPSLLPSLPPSLPTYLPTSYLPTYLPTYLPPTYSDYNLSVNNPEEVYHDAKALDGVGRAVWHLVLAMIVKAFLTIFTFGIKVSCSHNS